MATQAGPGPVPTTGRQTAGPGEDDPEEDD